jgi:hypothetical protein
MSNGTRSNRALVREAFDLLLELRSRRDAQKLLGQAVTFLRMLEHAGRPGALPVVVTVQVLHLRKH